VKSVYAKDIRGGVVAHDRDSALRCRNWGFTCVIEMVAGIAGRVLGQDKNAERACSGGTHCACGRLPIFVAKVAPASEAEVQR